MPAYDAAILTLTPESLRFFDECLKLYSDAKNISNWMMGEMSRLLNQQGIDMADNPIKPENLAKMLKLMDEGTISGKMAKTVFEEMFASGKTPEQIVKEKGLVQISDEGALLPIIEGVVASNPKALEDYKNGKEKAFGSFVGQVMKATKGQANPAVVNKLLLEVLNRE